MMDVLFITNTIGLVSSLVCIIIFLVLVLKDSKFVNRITLRLQVALSVIDLVAHILLYLHEGQYSDQVCSLIGFLLVYQNSVYITVVLFVTLILHLNFLVAKKFNGKYEKFVWGSIVVLPLIHNIPPFVLDMFGLDNYGNCFINTTKPNNEILIFTNLITPTAIVFVYCLGVTIAILYRIRTGYNLTDHIINTPKISDQTSRNLLQRLLQNWILRLIMYPAAFCLMDSGIVIDFFLQIVFGYSSNVLFYWAAVGGRLSGFFNLIAFLLDPYIHYAFKNIRQSYKQRSTVYPLKSESEPYSHEINMTEFNDAVISNPEDSDQITVRQEDNLSEGEAVALLQGFIRYC